MGIAQWVSLVMLGCNTAQDLRKREIFLRATIMTGIAGLLWSCIRQNVSPLLAAAALFPGALLLLLAWATGGKIGFGDGFAVLALGAWIGVRQILFTVTAALFLSAAVSIVLCLRRRRPESIPFIPFLLAAYLTCIYHFR